MTVTTRVGDLFSSGIPVLAHGCNCAGAMGKGIALEFRQRWPGMYQEYRRRCRDGSFALGDLLVWQESEVTVVNIGTQQTWRTKADLSAIEDGFGRMVEWAEGNDVAQVGMPRIGAGLGGRDWADVAPILESAAGESFVSVVVFELPVSVIPPAL